MGQEVDGEGMAGLVQAGRAVLSRLPEDQAQAVIRALEGRCSPVGLGIVSVLADSQSRDDVLRADLSQAFHVGSMLVPRIPRSQCSDIFSALKERNSPIGIALCSCLRNATPGCEPSLMDTEEVEDVSLHLHFSSGSATADQMGPDSESSESNRRFTNLDQDVTTLNSSDESVSNERDEMSSSSGIREADRKSSQPVTVPSEPGEPIEETNELVTSGLKVLDRMNESDIAEILSTLQNSPAPITRAVSQMIVSMNAKLEEISLIISELLTEGLDLLGKLSTGQISSISADLSESSGALVKILTEQLGKDRCSLSTIITSLCNMVSEASEKASELQIQVKLDVSESEIEKIAINSITESVSSEASKSNSVLDAVTLEAKLPRLLELGATALSKLTKEQASNVFNLIKELKSPLSAALVFQLAERTAIMQSTQDEISELIMDGIQCLSKLARYDTENILQDLETERTPLKTAINHYLGECQTTIAAIKEDFSNLVEDQNSEFKPGMPCYSADSSHNLEVMGSAKSNFDGIEIDVHESQMLEEHYTSRGRFESNLELVELLEYTVSEDEFSAENDCGANRSPSECSSLNQEISTKVSKLVADGLHAVKSLPEFQSVPALNTLKNSRGISAESVLKHLRIKQEEIDNLLDSFSSLVREGIALFLNLACEDVDDLWIDIKAEKSLLASFISKHTKQMESDQALVNLNIVVRDMEPCSQLSFKSDVDVSNREMENIDVQIRTLVKECGDALSRMTADQSGAVLNDILLLRNPFSRILVKYLVDCSAQLDSTMITIPILIRKCCEMFLNLTDEAIKCIFDCIGVPESCIGKAVLFNLSQSHAAVVEVSESVSLLLKEGHTLLQSISDDLASNLISGLSERHNLVAEAICSRLNCNYPQRLPLPTSHHMNDFVYIEDKETKEDICNGDVNADNQTIAPSFESPQTIMIIGNQESDARTVPSLVKIENTIDDTSSEHNTDSSKSFDVLATDENNHDEKIEKSKISNFINRGKDLQEHEGYLPLQIDKPPEIVKTVPTEAVNLFKNNLRVVSEVSDTIAILVNEGSRLVSRLKDDYSSKIIQTILAADNPAATAIVEYFRRQKPIDIELHTKLADLIYEGSCCMAMLSEISTASLLADLFRGDTPLAKSILNALNSDRDNLGEISQKLSSLIVHGGSIVSSLDEVLPYHVDGTLLADLAGSQSNLIESVTKELIENKKQISEIIFQLIVDGSKAISSISEMLFVDLVETLYFNKSPLALAIKGEISRSAECTSLMTDNDNNVPLKEKDNENEMYLNNFIDVKSKLQSPVMQLIAEGKELLQLLPDSEVDKLVNGVLRMESFICKAIIHKLELDCEVNKSISSRLSSLAKDCNKVGELLIDRKMGYNLIELRQQESELLESELDFKLLGLIREGAQCISLLTDDQASRLINTVIGSDGILTKSIISNMFRLNSLISDLTIEIEALIREGVQGFTVLPEEHVFDFMVHLKTSTNLLASAVKQRMNNLGFTELNLGSENGPEKDQNIQSLISLLVTEGNTLMSGLSQNQVSELVGDLQSSQNVVGKAVLHYVKKNYIMDKLDTLSYLIEEGHILISALGQEDASNIIDDLITINSTIATAVVTNLLKNERNLLKLKDTISELVKEGEVCLSLLAEESTALIVEDLESGERILFRTIAMHFKDSDIEPNQKNQNRCLSSLNNENLSPDARESLLGQETEFSELHDSIKSTEAASNTTADVFVNIWNLLSEGILVISQLSRDLGESIIEGIEQMNTPLAQYAFLRLGDIRSVFSDTLEKFTTLLADGRVVLTKLGLEYQSDLIDSLDDQKGVVAKAILRHLRKDRILSNEVLEMIQALVNEGSHTMSLLSEHLSNDILDDLTVSDNTAGNAIRQYLGKHIGVLSVLNNNYNQPQSGPQTADNCTSSKDGDHMPQIDSGHTNLVKNDPKSESTDEIDMKYSIIFQDRKPEMTNSEFCKQLEQREQVISDDVCADYSPEDTNVWKSDYEDSSAFAGLVLLELSKIKEIDNNINPPQTSCRVDLEPIVSIHDDDVEILEKSKSSTDISCPMDLHGDKARHEEAEDKISLIVSLFGSILQHDSPILKEQVRSIDSEHQLASEWPEEHVSEPIVEDSCQNTLRHSVAKMESPQDAPQDTPIEIVEAVFPFIGEDVQSNKPFDADMQGLEDKVMSSDGVNTAKTHDCSFDENNHDHQSDQGVDSECENIGVTESIEQILEPAAFESTIQIKKCFAESVDRQVTFSEDSYIEQISEIDSLSPSAVKNNMEETPKDSDCTKSETIMEFKKKKLDEAKFAKSKVSPASLDHGTSMVSDHILPDGLERASDNFRCLYVLYPLHKITFSYLNANADLVSVLTG